MQKIHKFNIFDSKEFNGSTIRKILIVGKKNNLQDAGKVTAEIAKSFAESEFEKYRPIQDKLFESDFDRDVKRILEIKKKK